ncbi:uncharacterized protein LOC100209399 isoform X2 [Hydra vulgaris]|uniref:Uncharacterized protein LOC100209399 isoform X2 n=1 Tax=Hydra vulgaris TaxID=6087 RepID=A0ABM4BRM6_HYDVU
MKNKDTFKKDVLDQHNKYRRNHGVPELKWSYLLEGNAHKWAKKCLKSLLFDYDEQTQEGENIAVMKDIEVSGTTVVDYWYKEMNSYDFSNDGLAQKTGCFTQLIWKSTIKVGVARVSTSNGTQFIVARYFPPGNNLRKVSQNVLPPTIRHMSISRYDGDDRRLSMRPNLAVISPDSPVNVSSLRRASSMGSSLPKASGPIQSDGVFRDELLTSHNLYRSRHNAKPLSLSSGLTLKAQQVAETIAKNEVLTDFDNIGRNMLACTKGITGNEASSIWYNEENDFNYNNKSFSMKTGSFTQMIWKETKEIGVGRAIDDRGCTHVVCLYKPAGNIRALFEENVGLPNGPPPKFIY